MKTSKLLTRAVVNCVFGAATVFYSAITFAGFSVSGTQLLDGNGQPFVMRGINHAHVFYRSTTQAAIQDIAKTGANVVRVVLSNGTHGGGWQKIPGSEVGQIIGWCKDNKIICMFNVQDTTGFGDDASATSVAKAASYWLEIASYLKGQEDYVLINIANEPFGNSATNKSNWVDQHVTAIKALRNAGLTHTLIVDAPNWGQDWQNVMLDNASAVASADTLKNTLFSVHMYEVYADYNKINTYMSSFASKHNLPLIVGEFGYQHGSNPIKEVDEASIMELAEQYDVGYLGWSWSGNGGGVEYLDLVNSFNASSLTSWGKILINGTNGIKATSKRASIFGGVTASSSVAASSSSRPNTSSSAASNSSAPKLCADFTPDNYPYCRLGDSTDADSSGVKDGWGWENEASCVVPYGATDTAMGGCAAASSSLVASSSAMAVSSSAVVSSSSRVASSSVAVASSSLAVASSSVASSAAANSTSSSGSSSSAQVINLGGSFDLFGLLLLMGSAALRLLLGRRNSR